MRTPHYAACLMLAAVFLTACGGGDGQATSTCSLTNPSGCGGTLQAPPTSPPPLDPALQAAAITLVFSSNELPSAGLAGNEVTVTALVKNAGNSALAGAAIDFSADSGVLAGAAATTDQAGKASATLGTGGSPQNRPIVVTVKVGKQSASAVVNVVGTRLLFNGPAFLALGSSADAVATVLDSAGRPVAGAVLAVSTINGNAVQLLAKASDSRGEVPLRLQASQRGSEQLTLSALGASLARTIVVGSSDVTLAPAIALDAAGAELLAQVAVGACFPVDGSYVVAGVAKAGQVSLTASRGSLYSDAACSLALAGPLPLQGGAFPHSYIKSDNAGVSSIDAAIAGGPSGATRLEFVATLLASSHVNLQAEQAVLGSGERSNLIAVVRDGTAANNLVKGVTVQFSIVSDPSGGVLLSPFSAVTGSDGVARGAFVAGPADGGKNGTVLLARIAELPAATGWTSLTVSKKALSIQFGTGNSLVEYSASVLQQDFAVFVSDGAGNPVSGVTISAAGWPTMYRKGAYEYYVDTAVVADKGVWRVAADNSVCANEDLQRNGVYELAYDLNNDGVLEPGIPLSVSSSGKTDASGIAAVALRYPRDRANWVRVELTVSGTVAGTESAARNSFWLAPLAKDLTDRNISPPGRISPYGVADCASAY